MTFISPSVVKLSLLSVMQVQMEYFYSIYNVYFQLIVMHTLKHKTQIHKQIAIMPETERTSDFLLR